jgi:DNA-binding response OmpR family regulator
MPTRILVVDDSPTIRTVVSSILERSGYEPKVAADGQEAYDALASGAVKADLVLVDFVMPRMNGYQLCRAIRDHAELMLTPIVLMSAKADRIRDQFVEQTGAVDAITKPFDAQALVAVIENVLRKVHAVTRSSSARLVDLGSEETTPPAPALVIESETRRTHVEQIVAQKLATIAAQAMAERSELFSTESKRSEALVELTNAIVGRLSAESILELVDVIGELRGGKGALLSGDLGVVPIGAVLQLLQAENQTGVLVCTNGHAEVRATFRAGVIDLVQSTGAGDEFRLGRFFVEEGVLTPAEIDEVTREATRAAEAEAGAGGEAPPCSSVHPAGSAHTPKKKLPLGMALLSLGKIQESQLRAALSRQSSELIYEVLRWPAGRFELRREAPSELAVSARLGLPVASVVMEGFRRVDEWRVLERTLGSFDTVLLRDDTAFGKLDVGSLPAKERAVLDAVDGERTIRAIVAASNLSSFDACRILVQFLEARALRRRVA